MLVFCDGMPRSASTWSYNVVVELLRRVTDGEVYGGYDENVRRFLESVPSSAAHTVLKCHTLDPPGQRLTRIGAAKVIYTWRDLADAMTGTSVRRIICFPYLPADAVLSIATKEMFGAPLCTYIMDDKNVCAEGISDELVTELLGKSDLRLVISPEMRDAYENKYGMRFWLVPPLVSDEIVRRHPVHMPEGTDPRCGVLIGNIWGQRWLDMLRGTFRDSGYQVDWYCNHKNPEALVFDRAEMERDGIRLMYPIPEAQLPEVLSQYP